MKMRWGTLVGAVVLLGCGEASFIARSDAERNPYCAKARKAVERLDFDGAVEAYQKALLVNPELADAHLEIGVLYEDKKKDPVAAIYHYRRCAELHPQAAKRQMAKDFIERAKVSLLTSLPQSTMLDVDALARLQADKTNLAQENAMLRARVAELEKALETQATAEILRAEANPPPAVLPPLVAAAAPAASTVAGVPEPASGRRTHLVQKGDTLYSLALRYYGNRAEWQRIYLANQHALPNKDQLKIGQQLVIP